MTVTATTGDQALNAALDAGFEVERHARTARGYWHDLRHADGRALSLYTEIGTGRFVSAQGHNRDAWATTSLCVRSLPALRRMIAPEATR